MSAEPTATTAAATARPQTRRRVLLAGGVGVLAALLGARWVWLRHGARLMLPLVEADYEAERLVNVGGWLISSTEARLSLLRAQ